MCRMDAAMKVFLAYESVTVVEMLATWLSGIEGIEIVGQAMNPADAIRSIVRLKPDVVVLDIRLQEVKTGLDLIIRIKKVVPPPIIMLVAFCPSAQYREQCLSLGADYFFDKIKEIRHLYDTLKKLLADRS